MFMQSLLDSSAYPRRGWTAAVSFAVQAIVLTVLVLLPMFYTQALPAFVTLGHLIGPPPGEAPRPAAPDRHTSRTTSNSEIVGNTVREPMAIRRGVADIHDEGGPPAPYTRPGVPGITGSGEFGLQIMSLLPPPPTPPAPAPTRSSRPLLISSGVSQGLLIQQVRPFYPHLAIISRIQGTVVLSAVISRSGVIENLHATSGHPLLIPAALEAVRQWRYRPYLLNGEPVEVETQVTVNFVLGN